MKKIPLSKCVRLTPCTLLLEVWADDEFMAMVMRVEMSEQAFNRISISRMDRRDGITWDQIEDIKNKIGFCDYWGVELYPPKHEIMNSINIRHIFLLKQCPDYAFDINNVEKLKKQMGQ